MKTNPAQPDQPRTVSPAHQVIFFGNGPLADAALATLSAAPGIEIIFHARTPADLTTVTNLKRQHPAAFGILASFGVLIKPDLLQLFEPTGILNLHPSLLPAYRGASPIESAILAGGTDFSYSIMKLARRLDAGPIYHQATLTDLPLDKSAIYAALASAGAAWLAEHLNHLPTPTPQDDAHATYTAKLDKSLSQLHPERDPADLVLRQIIAYQGYPKPKYQFFGHTCIIRAAHLTPSPDLAAASNSSASSLASTSTAPADFTPGAPLITPDHQLLLPCAAGALIIDQLQPAGKAPMPARAFLNGYAKV